MNDKPPGAAESPTTVTPREIDPLDDVFPSLSGVLRPGAGPEQCGDFNLRIGRDGTWYYHGSPIGRKPLVRLFSSVLRREGGEYWLVTPAERGRIVVDDAPFVAVSVDVEGAGETQCLRFTTNIDDQVTADAEHPIRVAVDDDTGEPRPYILVRDGLEALILRPVFYELVERSVEKPVSGDVGAGDIRYGVWSNGQFFPLT